MLSELFIDTLLYTYKDNTRDKGAGLWLLKI